MIDLLEYCKSDAQRKVIEAVNKHGSSNKAAKALDQNRRSVDKTLKRVREQAAARLYSPEHRLPAGGPPGFLGKRISQHLDKNGQVDHQWNIWEADKLHQMKMMQELAESFAADIEERRPPKKIKLRKAEYDEDCGNFIMIGDAHIGMRAYTKETLDDNHDVSIAINDLYNAVYDLVAKAPLCKTVYLVNVGDFFHANDISAKTPGHGNPLDVDGRFGDVIDNALVMFCHVVELLLSVYPEVKIVNAKGNHDPEAAAWFSRLVAARWWHEPRVEVMSNDSKFINIMFGKNFISIHHGDRLKRDQWYQKITRDFRDLWGQSVRAFGWSGHIHHKDAIEIGGCLFESWNVLPPPDEWHSANGFGAAREMQLVTMHKEYGIIGRSVCPVELAREYEYTL